MKPTKTMNDYRPITHEITMVARERRSNQARRRRERKKQAQRLRETQALLEDFKEDGVQV